MARKRSSARKTYDVTIRSDLGQELLLPLTDAPIFRKGFSWRKIAGSRERLTASAREEAQDRATRDLSEFAGLPVEKVSSRLAELSAATTLEVSIPFLSEEEGWGARTFPWESFLSYATKPFRRSRRRPFAIVRHLQFPRSRNLGPATPSTLLAVQSAPGDIGNIYDFENELQLVERSLAFPKDKVRALRNPTRDMLQGIVEERQDEPSVIHLAGIDPLTVIQYASHFGLGEEEVPDRRDGFILKSASEERFDSVSCADMASILVPNKAKAPALVSFASSFSAARMAPMAVAQGVHTSVAFSGITDDMTCSLFFPYFYSYWRQSDWNVLPAFVESLAWLKKQPQADVASGLVLWTRQSILAAAPSTPKESNAEEDLVRIPSEESLVTPARLSASQVINVWVEPRRKLNYSLLHNAFVQKREDTSGKSERERRSPFFHRFALDRTSLEFRTPVDIEVRLNVGVGDCVCRLRKEWPENSLSMYVQDHFAFPLVANLQRQAYEQLNTTLEINVSCDGEKVFQTTKPMTLLPADEWLDFDSSDILPEDRSLEDDDRSQIDGRPWLASFSLPRDPAVLEFVTVAQRYLRTLVDDAACGFDGYQRAPRDPQLAAEIVDPQVQAFWAGMLHDMPLAYINPPPAYSEFSQRLRTPTTIFRGRTATCIDLALLFASILEYVGVAPVLFLVKGHAFPGYWRCDSWSEELLNETSNEIALEDEHSESLASFHSKSVEDSSYIPPRTYSWMYGIDTYSTLKAYIRNGKLVPFESTLVTQNGSFREALQTGWENFQEMPFDCMIDVSNARANNVTPLPILLRGDQHG